MDHPLIMRGLSIPDPNFIHPIGDVWSKSSGIPVADIMPRGSTNGVGRSLSIDVGTLGSNPWIYSDYSPYGIGNIPFLGSARNVSFWIGIVAKTLDIPSNNSSYVVRGFVNGYSSSGSLIASSSTVNLMQYSADWGIFSAISTMTATDAICYYKLYLLFANETSPSGSAAVHIDWAGTGFPIDIANGDKLENGYIGSAISVGSKTAMQQLTPGYKTGARSRVLGFGAHRQIVNISLPMLSLDDRDKVREAYYWNRGTPTDDVEIYCAGSSNNVLNRGTRQPVIVALDIEGVKSAFYANITNDIVFSESSPDWIPDTGTRWSTNLNLEEVI